MLGKECTHDCFRHSDESREDGRAGWGDSEPALSRIAGAPTFSRQYVVALTVKDLWCLPCRLPAVSLFVGKQTCRGVIGFKPKPVLTAG